MNAILQKRRLTRRKRWGKIFAIGSVTATLVGLAFLAVLLFDILRDGLPWLDWQFLTSFPSRFPEKAGILSALVGSLYVIGLTAIFALPLGVGAAVYLEEYAPKSWLTSLLNINIANLAGTPSIVYGLLGLGLFVNGLRLGKSILAGALTLTLLVLPLTIIAAREAIKAVPDSIRQAAYAVGATRWQVIRHHVLPYALPGILTGLILAISRAIGETAPLIMLGALQYVPFLPRNLLDYFTVLPIQIFNWISRPEREFHEVAAAGIIVLLAVLLMLNATAILLRNKYQRRW